MCCFSYKDSFTIVPVLVGSLTPEKEAIYGRIFSRYLADPQNLFVISSDFCHWGHRFRYTYYDRSWGEIYQSIQTLDRTVRLVNCISVVSPVYRNSSTTICNKYFVLQGMDIIETLNPAAFTEYLKKFGNTICGRHPIGVLLQVK